MRHVALLLPLLLAPLQAMPARADDAPSVPVTTEAPKRGSLPDLASVFGTAAPAFDGGMTLSLPQDGRVLSIAVTPGEQVAKGDALVEFGASATTSGALQQATTALAQRAHTAQLLAQQLATRDQLAQADKAVADARNTVQTLEAQGADRPRSTLTAPFDGVVNAIPVVQGDRVASGAPLDGTVRRVDGVLNPKTRLVDCDVEVKPGSVMPGEAFRADITVGALDGWVVPRDAVLVDGTGARLFQVADGKAVAVKVDVLGANGRTWCRAPGPGQTPGADRRAAALRRRRGADAPVTLPGTLHRHARSVVVVALALALAGVASGMSLPVGQFPQVAFPRVVVDLDAGSRPADQMALQVTRPVEQAVRGVPGVQNVRSGTSRGNAQVSIDFG